MVVGGGLIGVEVAEILHDRGLHVTFAIRDQWAFPAALEPRESAIVGEHMRGHGIDVRLGAVEATQAGEVVFSLGGELIWLSAPWPDPLSLAGLVLVVAGMTVHSLHAREKKAGSRRKIPLD